MDTRGVKYVQENVCVAFSDFSIDKLMKYVRNFEAGVIHRSDIAAELRHQMILLEGRVLNVIERSVKEINQGALDQDIQDVLEVQEDQENYGPQAIDGVNLGEV